MTREWQPALCANCNHTKGDHKDNGSSWPHPLVFGVCLVGHSPGSFLERCDCREFVPRGDWLDEIEPEKDAA